MQNPPAELINNPPPAYLNSAIANQAIEKYLPKLKALLKSSGRTGLNITVLSPSADWATIRPGEPDALDNILTERSINEENWAVDRPYRKFAQAKAMLSLREKMNSGDVPRMLLRVGDIIYRGAVYYKGLVVAISGLESKDDEKYSLLIAEECERLAEIAFTEWQKTHADWAFAA